MNKKAYQMARPKKRLSAGMLLFDERGQLLIVEPAYKDTWEIPGGVVEANESPRQAAMREVYEELGLQLEPVHLLCVDYSSETKQRTESLHFIFQGPVLVAKDIAAINLPRYELRSYRLLLPKQAVKLLNRKLRRRVRRSLKVVNKKRTLYTEEQRPV